MTYTTKAGDTWDAIAKECYGNEMMADRIMEANSDKLWIFQFDSGEKITLPEIDEEDLEGLPPWRD